MCLQLSPPFPSTAHIPIAGIYPCRLSYHLPLLVKRHFLVLHSQSKANGSMKPSINPQTCKKSIQCFAACWSGTKSPDIRVTVLNFAVCRPPAHPWQGGGRDRLRLRSFQKIFLTWRIFPHSESVPSFFAYLFRLQHPVINSVPTQTFQ